MSQPIIRVEGLGKRYFIGNDKQDQYVSLRDVISSKANQFKQKLSGHFVDNFSEKQEFWALKNVSFEIEKGEVVGIIGRNGAGKSTLLKILSRITEPTCGDICLKGRVSSLLEVGTGFHPELTGKENIFLNGAILGMRKREIEEKFDEIVDFSEISKFIHTPVKRYSSGMYVRLAFSVAAHLEPEILIIDEVLAVGDAAFQKKCLGKIGKVANSGRTVLFVSHDMNSIETLTDRCILLGDGEIVLDDSTRKTVDRYFVSTSSILEEKTIKDWPERIGNGLAKIISLNISGESQKIQTFFKPMEPINIKVGIEFHEELKADVGIVIETEREYPLFTSHLSDYSSIDAVLGCKYFSVKISPNYLKRGKYKISVAVFSKDFRDFYDVAYHFPAFEIDGMTTSHEFPNSERWGNLHFLLEWHKH